MEIEYGVQNRSQWKRILIYILSDFMNKCNDKKDIALHELAS